MLVNLKEILTNAQRRKYAVFATNAFNFDSAEAIIQAAEEKESPVILMTAEPLFEYLNFEKLVSPMISLSKEASVPVALNLDHGNSENVITKCIKAGMTSVMFDGSKLPLDENIRITKKITDIAHSHGISVEGEVGMVGGLEGTFTGNDPESIKKHYTKTEDAAKFVEETNVDALAISVGTVHGVFSSEPNIDFDRIASIRNAIETPLVLHGCSGLSDDDFKKVIRNGVTKINYFTDLILEASRKVKELINGEAPMTYFELNKSAMTAMKNLIKSKMDILGSAGKA